VWIPNGHAKNLKKDIYPLSTGTSGVKSDLVNLVNTTFALLK